MGKKLNSNKLLGCLILLSGIIGFIVITGGGGMSAIDLVTYPPPPGLTTSDEFSMKVNGKDVWVEKTFIPKRDVNKFYWPLDSNSHVNIANFSASGHLVVTLKILNTTVKSIDVHPRRLAIKGILVGNEFTFEVDAPRKLVIEVNEDRRYTLNIFANPLEVNPPRSGDPDVTYYGPGVHNIGRIAVVSGHTYYIAGGAVVYGGFNGNNVQNVKILGRGILDGRNGGGNCTKFQNCSNILVDGILTRNGSSGYQHTPDKSKYVTYNNIKVFDWARYGDGIDPVNSSNVTINDCYIRPADDCIAIKSDYRFETPIEVDSIIVTNCIMDVIPYGVGDGVTMSLI